MSLLQHVSQKTKQIKSALKNFTTSDTVQQPLLTITDVLDLYQRARQADSAIQRTDIAHKQTGENRSVYSGYGLDYEESRPYHPGDDPRYMNWKLTARSGQFFMKVFREERQAGSFILVDRRHSMRFGTKNQLKASQAVRIAALCAFHSQLNNASIGGVILDKQTEWFKESQQKQAAFDFVLQAARPCPVIHSNESEPRLSATLNMMNQILHPGTTVYLVSDFHDLDSYSSRLLLQLSYKHDVHAIHISDPSEHNLPSSANFMLKANIADTPKKVIKGEKTRQYYADEAENYFEHIRKLFSECAIPYQLISTTVDAIENKIHFRQL